VAGGTLKFDVLVLGAGLAGFAAAIAAHRKGKKVAVVAKSVGATAVSSGALDFGPISIGESNSFEAHCKSKVWKELYGRILVENKELLLAEEIKKSAMELSDAIGLDLSFRWEKPFCLPTSAGYIKYAFGCQAVQAFADLSGLKGKKIGLIGSKQWRFRSDLVATQLAAACRKHGVELDIIPLWLTDKWKGRDCSLSHLATRIAVDAGFREAFRESVLTSVKGSSIDFVLFPPLFLNSSFFNSLKETIGLGMAECLATIEPIAGKRLHEGITAGLEKEGIEYYPVSKIRPWVKGRKILGLQCYMKSEREPRSVAARQYILATGKFFGGGIHMGFERVHETALNLPVFIQRSDEPIIHRSQISWVDRGFTEDQPWANLGIRVDSEWRPIDAQEVPIYENLRGCGSLIGGVDFSKERLGLGFMAYSGRQSGQLV